MFLQLCLEGLVGDGARVLDVGVLEQRRGEVFDLLLAESHPVLLHTGVDDVLQLIVLDQTVT